MGVLVTLENFAIIDELERQRGRRLLRAYVLAMSDSYRVLLGGRADSGDR